MAKLQNSGRPFSLEKFLSIEVIGQYVATPPTIPSLEGRRRVTGGAEESHWRGGGESLEGRRRVTGGAEESHWRGGGESLQGGVTPIEPIQTLSTGGFDRLGRPLTPNLGGVVTFSHGLMHL